MALLDYSYDSSVSEDPASSLDLSALVDNGSLGTRTQDGLYEVKDWEFASRGDKNADDVIAQVLKKGGQEAKPVSGSLGALSSIFSRLTGSKVLTEDDLKPVLEAMKQHLMKKNVAKEIADKVCEDVGQSLVGKKVGGFQSMRLPVSVLPPFCVHLLTRNSHDLRCPPSARQLNHAHTYPQDINRPPPVHPDEVVDTRSSLATEASIQHDLRRRERCRQEHQSLQSLLLVDPERLPGAHRSV